jgi:hypothetical protein
VLSTPLQRTSPVTARRYDRDLHVVAETTIPGALDGVAATSRGFMVAVRDESVTPRKSAIYDVASPTPLFAFEDGRVASIWTVRGTDGTLRDPIAILTPTDGHTQMMRVRRGEHAVATNAQRTMNDWNAEAVETPGGIVLPAGRFEPLVRVRADGSTDAVPLPEPCHVRARYTPGWLAWLSVNMHATIVPVDDALRPRGTPSTFDARADAPVVFGDWLWLGGDDFARRDAGAPIVHLARGPVAPTMLTPFAGAVAAVWNRTPVALTLVPLP